MKKNEKTRKRFIRQMNEIKQGDEIEYNVVFMRRKDEDGFLFGFPKRTDISQARSLNNCHSPRCTEEDILSLLTRSKQATKTITCH